MSDELAHGILLVESSPASPEQLAEFHHWYDNVHLAEIVAVDGFVSARRLAPVKDDGTFLAIYEIEGDVAAAQGKLKDLMRAGGISGTDTVATTPPPAMKFYRTITSI